MTPGAFNLWIYRGDTYFWKFDLWHDMIRKYPINLVGAIAKMEIRDESGGRLRATCDCYIVTPNTVVATLSARQSEELTETDGVWDLQINSIGYISTVVRGTVTVEGDVTDSRATVQTTSRATGLVPFPKRGVRAA
jgi:hypothetical protein